MLKSFGHTSLVTSAILPDTYQAVDYCQPSRDGRSDRHSDKTWRIPWGIPGLEQKRPDKIACIKRYDGQPKLILGGKILQEV